MGFGFLRPDEGGRDVFVHHAMLLMDVFRHLTVGGRVRFETEQGEKGPRAVNVEPLL
jgi:CspA family cold shock protein